MRRPVGGRHLKRIFALTPVLSTLLVTGCGFVNSGSTTKADIVIAASLELTGPQAEVGKAYEDALRLKVEQINRSRRPSDRQVALKVSDNRSDVGVSSAHIDELAKDPAVSGLITGWCSECLLAAAGNINAKGVPTIALAPSTQVSTPVGERKYIFKLAPNANHDANALLRALVDSGVRSVRFMASTDNYGQDAQEAMTAMAERLSLRDLSVSPLNAGDSRYTQAARSITQAKPDAVVVLAYPTVAVGAVDALHEAGYKGRVALDATAAGALFITGSATHLEGATLVFTPTLSVDDVIATTPAKAAQKQWFQDYTARYGDYQAPASFAADAVQLLVDAADKAGSPTDHTAIRAALESVRTDGLTGPIRLNPNDHSGLMPQSLAILVARHGRWRLG